MRLLALIKQTIMLARGERRQYNPFGDRWAVDAGTGGDGDVAVGVDRVVCVVIHPGREEVDEFETGSVSLPG